MTVSKRPIRVDEYDVVGHGSSPEGSEGLDDTEGHAMRFADADTTEGEDDVAGHVQPPRDFEHLDR